MFAGLKLWMSRPVPSMRTGKAPVSHPEIRQKADVKTSAFFADQIEYSNFINCFSRCFELVKAKGVKLKYRGKEWIQKTSEGIGSFFKSMNCSPL